MTTDRHTYRYRSQKAHTYINNAQIKWDRKAVLGVHVLNPKLHQLVTITTDIHTSIYTEAKRHRLI